MKRIFMLTTVVLMLATAMALSGVAQARPISGPPDAKCAKLTIKTLGPSFNPSNYTFIGGTAGNDDFSGIEGPEVFCGFGGNDSITNLEAGDIFLGGEGNDHVNGNYGAFLGGEGNDQVSTNYGSGIVYGGSDDDQVSENYGSFYGGVDDDSVGNNHGIFVQD
jgi:Ca2+-binding RTX toxin-like protein